MNDLSLIEYNIYYFIKELAPEYTVLLIKPNIEKLEPNTIFIARHSVFQEPFQLGGGVERVTGFAVDVFSSNSVIHSGVVSTLLDNFGSNGKIIKDYTPIEGVSNFPFDPADSDIENLHYVEKNIGWMEFISPTSYDLNEEVLDKISYQRSVVNINVTYERI